MKIISKFKDFYDYKVAKYGMDELLVYDRRKTMPVISELPFPKKLGQCNALVGFELYIGNKMIFVFKSKDRVYTQFDMIFLKIRIHVALNFLMAVFLIFVIILAMAKNGILFVISMKSVIKIFAEMNILRKNFALKIVIPCFLKVLPMSRF